ncbi:MAG: hypothetical protein A2010_13045 [Nitrospirae bacterium GWD2_57_9]|nr:MAG: hypothetical protein A2010_13045 [Nitrospirae bacterium GWD2_57_9]
MPEIFVIPILWLRGFILAARSFKGKDFLVEPPPAGAGGSPQHRDLPELLTRDASFFTVARKRFPPPAGAGDAKARDNRPLELVKFFRCGEYALFFHTPSLFTRGICRSEGRFYFGELGDYHLPPEV